MKISTSMECYFDATFWIEWRLQKDRMLHRVSIWIKSMFSNSVLHRANQIWTRNLSHKEFWIGLNFIVREKPIVFGRLFKFLKMIYLFSFQNMAVLEEEFSKIRTNKDYQRLDGEERCWRRPWCSEGRSCWQRPSPRNLRPSCLPRPSRQIPDEV